MFGLILDLMRKSGAVPAMSETERVALEAGTVWIDGELFSGKPDFRRILNEPWPTLTEAERAFLDGPVQAVCERVDRHATRRSWELSEEVWALLREHRFFGLAIPPEYGGHGFSNLAMSAVFGKLGTAAPAVQSVVLIPNSVGPAELLVEVGTEEQKSHYLPRLARGDEIPCFALTEPNAGSDAASITSRGVLFRGDDGEPMLRLDWEKRYITLAPISTLLGLAFQLEDPDDLLGRGPDADPNLGITCALVPTDLPGVEVGRRHDPMGVPFPNGPTRGRGVVVPAKQIIGGLDYAGRGWQMLMEALSGGRAISLPASATIGAKYIARVTGAYSTVRQQFGLSVGRFEGVEEPLARIGGTAYLMEAARVFTCGAVDAGHRPSVISAIAKYTSTELGRQVACDGMDVLAGAGICRGPRNLVADAYLASPIGITVEGANILTRTLIVFGQGALRCHPHAHALLEAMRKGDVKGFRRALLGQVGHLLANGFRAKLLGLSRGRLARSPVSGPTARYVRRLAWASARFAFWADVAMATLGSKLKFRGKLTGRLADILAWMFLASAVLRRYEAEGRQREDLPLVHWAAQTCLANIHEGFDGFFANFDAPLIGWLVRGPVRWWNRVNPLGTPPSDRLGGEVAALLRRPGAQRDRLTSGLFYAQTKKRAFEELEEAFVLAIEAEPLVATIRSASRRGQLPRRAPESLLDEAVAEGLIDEAGKTLVERAAAARERAIAVDDFSLDELRGRVEHEAAAMPREVAEVAAG